MWQCTFGIDEPWGQNAVLARLGAGENIWPAKLLLQNIFESGKRVLVQRPTSWDEQCFWYMTMNPESRITISGKPHLKNVCQQSMCPVFSLARMGFRLTDNLVQPYQNLQYLCIQAEKGPPSYCNHRVVSSHEPSKMFLLVNWPPNSTLWLSSLCSFSLWNTDQI